MFKIGDFSRLSRVSVRALRLYDQMGLLRPMEVDPATGYRYYSAAQLYRLNQILAFKELGFSLEQIIQLLKDPVPPAEIRGMLRLKQAEVQQLIEAEQTRLMLIESRLQQIEQEGSISPYDVVLKRVESQAVAAIRDVLPYCMNIHYLYQELAEELQRQNIKITGFSQTLWHDPDYRHHDVDAEVVVPIDRLFPGNERIKSYILPEVKQMACVVYHGRHDSIVQAFNALLKWIEINHYQVIGSNRELYWQPEIMDPSFMETVDDLTIEIQFPVCCLSAYPSDFEGRKIDLDHHFKRPEEYAMR